jgi:hypothetical protein
METNIVWQEQTMYQTANMRNYKHSPNFGKKLRVKAGRETCDFEKFETPFRKDAFRIAKSRNLPVEEGLKYSLRPCPCSLATNEDLVKTVKSKLVSAIEGEINDDSVEADTRMITHERHAYKDYSIVVISPFIAMIACLGIGAAFLSETGVGNGRRIILLNKFKQHFGDK